MLTASLSFKTTALARLFFIFFQAVIQCLAILQRSSRYFAQDSLIVSTGRICYAAVQVMWTDSSALTSPHFEPTGPRALIARNIIIACMSSYHSHPCHSFKKDSTAPSTCHIEEGFISTQEYPSSSISANSWPAIQTQVHSSDTLESPRGSPSPAHSVEAF